MGRVKTYESIVKGENIPEPGIPESFRVLVKELQSLGLDIRLYNQDENNEVEILEDLGDDGVTLNITSPVNEDDELSDNMIIEDENGNAIDGEEDEFDEEEADFSEDAEFNDEDMLIDDDSFDD